MRVVEVDRERGRIGLRLADDPAIAGKSVEELAAIGQRRRRRPRGGGRDGGAAAATASRGGDRGDRGSGRPRRRRRGRDRDRALSAGRSPRWTSTG